MLHFRVPYTLEYYCSKPFRFSFNDKSNKITLIDSYATSSVTLDYDDIDSTTEYYGAFCSSRPELEQHHSGQKAAALEACDILAISSRLLAPSITARP